MKVHCHHGGSFCAGFLAGAALLFLALGPVAAQTNAPPARRADDKSAFVNLAMQAMQQLQSQQQATLRAVEDTRHEVETVSKRTAIVEIVLMVLLAGISLYAFTWLHGRRGRLAAPPMSGLVHAHVDQAASMAQLLAKGHELLRTKQLTASIACFDAVIALDGRSADAFVQKGVALERLGRLEEALDCYEQAIAIDHSSTDAFVGKGNVLNRLERYAEALQCYEEASHSQAKHAT